MLTSDFNKYEIKTFLNLESYYLYKFEDSEYDLTIKEEYTSSFFKLYSIKPKPINKTIGFIIKITNLNKLNKDFIVCGKNSMEKANSNFILLFEFKELKLYRVGECELITTITSKFGVHLEE